LDISPRPNEDIAQALDLAPTDLHRTTLERYQQELEELVVGDGIGTKSGFYNLARRKGESPAKVLEAPAVLGWCLVYAPSSVGWGSVPAPPQAGAVWKFPM
jgi:hypothetical protein